MLSIICPTYNSDKTLQRTLSSIKSQSYQSIELIVVDGGSTDKTLDIIRKNSDIISKFISEPDKGLWDAMNKGLDMISGDWVYFIGSDDYLTSSKVIEDIFGVSINADVDLLLGSVRYSNNKIFKSRFNKRIYFYCSVHHQGMFYRSRLFSNFRYSLKPNLPADYALNLSLFNRGVKHQYFDTVICEYALGGDSSNATWERYREEIYIRGLYIDSFFFKMAGNISTRARFLIKKFFFLFNYNIHI